ncbi:MAG: CDP-alcohol phosphatidyltransferase family protein [Gemmatimonadota bacterium]
MQINLPNAITISRIAATPIIAALIVSAGWQPRLSAWFLYLAAAITDYFDGKLARDRNLVTNFGKLLDPIADKTLLLATLIPMYWLTRDVALLAEVPAGASWAAGQTVGPVVSASSNVAWPFVTPIGLVGLPLWILVIVLGRELFMTGLRHYAVRRGIFIAAIGPAKWKATFQYIWIGAAFFWFFASSAAAEHRWTNSAWNTFAMFNGIVGVLAMIGAVTLTLWSLWLYLRRYGGLLTGRRRAPA